MNVFFNCDTKQLSVDDKDEIHLLYKFLENIKKK
jgi:hypothetical protein